MGASLWDKSTMRGFMKRDEVFKEPLKAQFSFDESVASVFDDMLSRSVPFYSEFLRLSSSFIQKNIKDGGTVVDLGSSTGALLLALARENKNLHLLGIDNSSAMVEHARKKSSAFGAHIEFIEADIFEYKLPKCDCIILNFTLQFIRPLQREALLKKIYTSLKKGGLLILSEKLISEDKKLDRQMIEEYYAYKKAQGYSELEIMQKREALENVLIPYTEAENRELLKECGFKSVELLFKWVNFGLFVGIK